jgi:hypothetical protein
MRNAYSFLVRRFRSDALYQALNRIAELSDIYVAPVLRRVEDILRYDSKVLLRHSEKCPHKYVSDGYHEFDATVTLRLEKRELHITVYDDCRASDTRTHMIEVELSYIRRDGTLRKPRLPWTRKMRIPVKSNGADHAKMASSAIDWRYRGPIF